MRDNHECLKASVLLLLCRARTIAGAYLPKVHTVYARTINYANFRNWKLHRNACNGIPSTTPTVPNAGIPSLTEFHVVH
jgi:hypothetical protein